MAVYWVGHAPSDKQIMTGLQNEHFVTKELFIILGTGLTIKTMFLKETSYNSWHNEVAYQQRKP